MAIKNLSVKKYSYKSICNGNKHINEVQISSSRSVTPFHASRTE